MFPLQDEAPYPCLLISGYGCRVLTHADEGKRAFISLSDKLTAWPDSKHFVREQPLPQPRGHQHLLLPTIADSEPDADAVSLPEDEREEEPEEDPEEEPASEPDSDSSSSLDTELLPGFIYLWAEHGEDEEDGPVYESDGEESGRTAFSTVSNTTLINKSDHKMEASMKVYNDQEMPAPLKTQPVNGQIQITLHDQQRTALEQLKLFELQLEKEEQHRAAQKTSFYRAKTHHRSIPASLAPILVRAVTVDKMPLMWTLATLAPNIRGGIIDQITWVPHRQNRPSIKIFFIQSQDAFQYYKFVTEKGGIPWYGFPGGRSFVSLVPAEDGGDAPISSAVLQGLLHEGVRRYFRIRGLPSNVGLGELRRAIHRYAVLRRGVRIVFESITRDAKHTEVKMASIEAAMAARDAITITWPRCYINWTDDECELPLDKRLLAYWKGIRERNAALVAEKGAEAVMKAAKWGDTEPRIQKRIEKPKPKPKPKVGDTDQEQGEQTDAPVGDESAHAASA